MPQGAPVKVGDKPAFQKRGVKALRAPWPAFGRVIDKWQA